MNKENKKAFNKKVNFQLLQVTFLLIFMFFIVLGIWGIFYEDDMPLVGFFWAGIVMLVYLLIKKYFMERIK